MFLSFDKPTQVRNQPTLERRTTPIVREYRQGRITKGAMEARIRCIYRQHYQNNVEAGLKAADTFIASVK